MAKNKKRRRKLTPAQKRAKKERYRDYDLVFIRGKQVRIKRPPSEHPEYQELMRAALADPIWVHQNEMWEYMSSESGLDELIAAEEDLDSDDESQPLLPF